MSRGLSLRAAAAAVCLLALTIGLWPSPPSDAAKSSLVQPAPAFRGVNIAGLGEGSSLAQADHEIAWARKLHANVVRIEIPWSVLEPHGPGQVDAHAVAFIDRLAQVGAASGIRILMMVDSTPCWASSAPKPLRHGCSPGHTSRAKSWPPGDPAAYGTAVAFLAKRYGPNLAAIEVWNEPDQINEQHFAGPDKARRYAAILKAAYRAIKQASPGVTVLGGSLVGSNGVFLRALYAAGIKGYYDGLAVHFYTLTLAALREMREAQSASGDSAPLWLDEFGWSSCWPGYKIQQEQACVTRQVQAQNLGSVVRSVARLPYVAAIVVYKLQGSGSEDFGVLNSSGSSKPGFGALASALARPLPTKTAPVTVRLGRSASGLLVRGSAPPGDYMRLEVFQGSLLRMWAVFTLDRFNRYSLRLPAVLGTRGLRVRVYQYFGGPGRAAQRSI
jgi:hypothetical protein